MKWQGHEPPYAPAKEGSVVILAAEPGVRRDSALERWRDDAGASGADTWRLRCAPEVGGIWAGLAEFIESVVAQMPEATDLLAAHGYEISLILPRYRPQLDVSRPLTDTAAPGEQTRNYPADRAYRSLHGLVDLLSAWHTRVGGRPWAIVCDDYDRANGLVRRFFQELARRRAQHLGLQLLVAVNPNHADDVAASFANSPVVSGFRPSWPAEADSAVAVPDALEMADRAAALEALVESDASLREVELPRLINFWQLSTAPERALRWQVTAVHAYNHYGLYEAALAYADDIEANLDRIRSEDAYEYFLAVNGLFFCWVPLGQPERARKVLEGALAHLDRSALPRVYYLMAMLHARFLGAQDLDRAEAYLQQALGLLPEVDLPEDDRQFLNVFLMNGLALIRVRQRRAQDAVELCQSGLDRLRTHLDPGHHRLHRSVLLYNIAQVYAQIGPYDRALDYFAQTMELDPNYSEYYNERGAVLLRMGRLAEAEADFARAIDLSPPYAEVWVNLGQCRRARGRLEDAVAAYSRALDLEPGSSLAWAGRADANAGVGRSDEALADFGEALRLDPSQPLVWAGRAVVHYEQGKVFEAGNDLDRAVALAPGLGELRHNRAVALHDLGHLAEAAADLRTYLDLCPDAEDRSDIERQIDSLTMVTAS